MTYRYGDKTFTSSEAALEAQKVDQDKVLAEIRASGGPPLKTRALVVLPSRSLLLDKGIKYTGDASTIPLESRDLLVRSMEEANNTMVEALRRRRIFAEVAQRESNLPDGVSDSNFDVVIYMALKGPNQSQWFLKTSSSGKPVLIAFDQSQSVGINQTNAWLDGVEKTAKDQLQERGKAK
ncbi:MAG: hypothetical protein D4R73_03685 [Deltaproteobacteria bacterium]|nr:MAG: hypothetical protein D4R73_03685 [Deltaproteobacteria bacterium]